MSESTGTCYRYTEAWRQRVGRESREWMEYCEARSLARRFLAIEARHGRDAALTDLAIFKSRVLDHRGAQALEALLQRMKEVGIHESAQLREEARLMPPCSVAQAAPAEEVEQALM